MNRPAHHRMMHSATVAAILAATLLIAIKFYAWLLTDSASILSSLVDSVLDAIVSLMNMLAVRYALMPPDEDHKFGHSSAEDVSALAQSAFVAGSAVFIVISAVRKWFNPTPIEHGTVGMAVMFISILVTLALVRYQKYVVSKTGSTAIAADSLHYMGDLLMNSAVIAALVLSSTLNFPLADPIFALLIAVYILHGAWKIARLAFDKLMDKSFSPTDEAAVVACIESQEGVLGFHDLKTRHSGIKAFIQFHLELNGSQTLSQAHEITDRLERKLLEQFPGGEVIIHQDPKQS